MSAAPPRTPARPPALADLPASPAGTAGSPWRLRVGLAAFCALLSLGGIAGKSLTYHDETRVAGIAREMALEGEYALPRLNGALFLEYPPLGYLPLAALFRLGAPPNDFLMLLPSAIAGLLTVFLTYRIGRRMGGERAGLVSALVLQCTFGFLALNARALVDPLLVFWITAALCGFVGALEQPQRRGRCLALFYAGLAGGFLTKGLIGLGVPCAVAFAYTLAARRTREIPRIALHGAVALLLVPVASWLWAAGLGGGDEIGVEIWRQSVWRFFSDSADHSKPLHFYLDRISYLLAPAVVLLPWLLWDALAPKARRLVRSSRPLDALPAIWFLVVLGVLSLASAKRNVYLGPIYPAFALMVGTWWARARAQPPNVRPWRWLAAAMPRSDAGCSLALALYALAYLGYAIGVERPYSIEHDTRPLFEDAARLRDATGGSLVLLNPREAIQGAAVYYLGETLPVAWDAGWRDALGRAEGDSLLLGREEFVEPVVAALGETRARLLARHEFAGKVYEIALVRGHARRGAGAPAD
ncbi:MAG TPA: glycosyltransferase family 39 protein [Myxococcota bacterium]